MKSTEPSSSKIQNTVSFLIQTRESTNPLEPTQIEPTQIAAFCREHDTSVWFYFGVREELASRNLLDAKNPMRLYACIRAANQVTRLQNNAYYKGRCIDLNKRIMMSKQV